MYNKFRRKFFIRYHIRRCHERLYFENDSRWGAVRNVAPPYEQEQLKR
jgi:hypothetical protein